jgi:hypothetical protein
MHQNSASDRDIVSATNLSGLSDAEQTPNNNFLLIRLGKTANYTSFLLCYLSTSSGHTLSHEHQYRAKKVS